MNVNIDVNEGINAISQYESGYFVVNERKIDSHVLISADRLEGWEANAESSLYDPKTLQEVITEQKPEVVIFGTGQRQKQLDIPLIRKLIALEVGYEVMDTGAACRTYNLLLADSRRVLGILETI